MWVNEGMLIGKFYHYIIGLVGKCYKWSYVRILPVVSESSVSSRSRQWCTMVAFVAAITMLVKALVSVFSLPFHL